LENSNGGKYGEGARRGEYRQEELGISLEEEKKTLTLPDVGKRMLYVSVWASSPELYKQRGEVGDLLELTKQGKFATQTGGVWGPGKKIILKTSRNW